MSCYIFFFFFCSLLCMYLCVFMSVSPVCVLARLFCKCVGVQGLLEKYAGSSVFFSFVFLQMPPLH